LSWRPYSLPSFLFLSEIRKKTWFIIGQSNSALKNAIATIQYKAADGNTYTGSFFFDRNGTMQTGWQQVDGVWYYFNTAQGATYGMMLTNTTTPDGYPVGANGAWIH